MSARRSEGVGSCLLVFEKREKASLISDSVEAGILFSFARADCRGAFPLAVADGCFLGGCKMSDRVIYVTCYIEPTIVQARFVAKIYRRLSTFVLDKKWTMREALQPPHPGPLLSAALFKIDFPDRP